MLAGCWSRRPGITGLTIGPAEINCGAAGRPHPRREERAHAANHRLHTRWAGFDQRKKRPVIANAAIARELAGWCWSLAVMHD